MGKGLELRVPKHIGFIMDGNRRWARSKGLPTLEGHRIGFNRLKDLVENCIERGVGHVTVFAFSTENWDRKKSEVKYLMDLFREMLDKTARDLHKKDVRIIVAGRIEDFASDIQLKMNQVVEKTKNNKKLTLNLCLSYGGRAEIVDAVKKIISKKIDPSKLTEEKFSEYIYEAGQPDPEIIVRTSGEKRLSGFMLWQSAYSEFYFTDKCWPDFDLEELDKVILEYNSRERRYGK